MSANKMSFPININNTLIQSDEILPYLRKCNSDGAINYIIDATNCEIEEATKVVSELKNMISQKHTGRSVLPNYKESISQNIKSKEDVVTFSVTCPYCNSPNVKKVGIGGRLASTLTLGIASSKIGKQWHCNNCKSNF